MKEYRIIGIGKLYGDVVVFEEGYINIEEAQEALGYYENEYPNFNLKIEEYQISISLIK